MLIEHLSSVEGVNEAIKQFQHRFAHPGKLGIDCLTKDKYRGGVLNLLEGEKPDSTVLANESDDWIDIEFEVALDSGCTDHVCDPDDARGYVVEESAGSKRKQKFLVGNGERIPNQGQIRLNLQGPGVNGASNNIDSTFQAAKVSRPLMSVGRICDSGLRVEFDKNVARVISQDGKVLTVFEREAGGLYLARMRLKRPFIRHG